MKRTSDDILERVGEAKRRFVPDVIGVRKKASDLPVLGRRAGSSNMFKPQVSGVAVAAGGQPAAKRALLNPRDFTKTHGTMVTTRTDLKPPAIVDADSTQIPANAPSRPKDQFEQRISTRKEALKVVFFRYHQIEKFWIDQMTPAWIEHDSSEYTNWQQELGKVGSGLQRRFFAAMGEICAEVTGKKAFVGLFDMDRVEPRRNFFTNVCPIVHSPPSHVIVRSANTVW